MVSNPLNPQVEITADDSVTIIGADGAPAGTYQILHTVSPGKDDPLYTMLVRDLEGVRFISVEVFSNQSRIKAYPSEDGCTIGTQIPLSYLAEAADVIANNRHEGIRAIATRFLDRLREIDDSHITRSRHN